MTKTFGDEALPTRHFSFGRPTPDRRPGHNEAPHLVARPNGPGHEGARVRRRPQWGHDRRTQPLPVVPPPISDRRIGLARLFIVFTVLAWVAYFITWMFQDLAQPFGRPPCSRAPRLSFTCLS